MEVFHVMVTVSIIKAFNCEYFLNLYEDTIYHHKYKEKNPQGLVSFPYSIITYFVSQEWFNKNNRDVIGPMFKVKMM